MEIITNQELKAPGRRLTGNLLGIACMLVSGVLLTSNDAFAKLIIPHLSVAQLVFIHASLVVCLLILMGAVRGELRTLSVRSWPRQLVRAACYVVGTFAFITSLRYLTLADTVAIAFVSPVLVAALAPFWLGERARMAHWLAVSLGFAGMLIMLRPGFGMHWAMLLPLAVAVADAFRDLITRQMTSSESTLSILLVTMVMVVVTSAPFAATNWMPLTGDVVLLLMAAAVVFVFAHYFMVEAFRHGEAVAVTPFRFLQLIWSALAGFAIWGDVPDLWIVIGAVLTVISGLLILRQEARC